MHQESRLPASVRTFDDAPDSLLLDLRAAVLVAGRSRVSLYRDNRAGLLPFVKVGKSTRIRVGDLRKLIGAVREAA